jgi:hypothetical protein
MVRRGRLPSIDWKQEIGRRRKPDTGIRTEDAPLDRDLLPQIRRQKRTLQYACLPMVTTLSLQGEVDGRSSRSDVCSPGAYCPLPPDRASDPDVLL